MKGGELRLSGAVHRAESHPEGKLLWIFKQRGQELVGKFTHRYCRELHEQLASIDLAPALYEARALAGGWTFVKMECLARCGFSTRAHSCCSAVLNHIILLESCRAFCGRALAAIVIIGSHSSLYLQDCCPLQRLNQLA